MMNDELLLLPILNTSHFSDLPILLNLITIKP